MLHLDIKEKRGEISILTILNFSVFSSCEETAAVEDWKMAPTKKTVLPLVPRVSFDLNLPSRQFSAQLMHPGDVFSVLMILGGDVVGKALAQVAGTGLTPVTFSFGLYFSLCHGFTLTFRYAK